jgi:hypothetical protein
VGNNRFLAALCKQVMIYLTLLLPLSANAQSGIIPLSLLKFRDNYTFDNPAAAVLTEFAELKIIHSSYTNLAGNVGLNYLEANFTAHSKSKNNVHIPGLLVHSEYDTDILKRTRLYLRYSWNTNISKHTKLSAGIQAGFFNYSVRASSSSNGISAFAPDANIGLWLQGKRMNLGISSAQILNSEVKPISTIYSLNRYLNFVADYKFLSTQNSMLCAGMKLSHDGKNYRNLIAALIFQLKKHFSTEINYSLNKGFIFSAGAVQLPFMKLHGDLFFSYFYSMNNYLNNDRLEISTRIYFTRSKL